MKKIAAITLLVSSLCGCSMSAPNYQPSVDNVETLKKAGDFKAKVSEFKNEPSNENRYPIGMRGASMTSPYQDSFAGYLAEAVTQELKLADRYDPASQVDISGVLLKNNVDTFPRGAGSMEARFIVTNAGQVRYDQVKSTETVWRTSFMGAVAVPNAIAAYPDMVRKLISTLFNDQAFLDALK
ncbi:hypothetical protein [Bordetella genomosp. 13]|uniref:hypothetical protein n=1 Tax=Bordetella genomosp. 13 TaxID=463040 RepID=UPI0011A99E3A|nr:hypothetical protein [Bordetella genomosp. 13]